MGEVLTETDISETDEKMSEIMADCSTAESITGMKRKYLDVDSQTTCMSLKLKPAAVRAERGTVKWLQEVIDPLVFKPSAELQRFLLLVNATMVDQVTNRAHIIVYAIFPDDRFGGRLISDCSVRCFWSEQRNRALKLYYRVMEAICASESEKFNTANLITLLTNERFHRSMLACSAELVSAAYTGMNLLFPMVFETTGITAFDLTKVIETFIKHEPSLPRELRQHLNSLEEQLLESMIWEKGSSLYTSLLVAKPDLSPEIRQLGLLADPLPSLDEVFIRVQASPRTLHHLPVLDQDRAVQTPNRVLNGTNNHLGQKRTSSPPVAVLPNTYCSPDQVDGRCKDSVGVDSPVKTSKINKQLNLLCNKMLKLAAIRIKNMAERLKLPQQIQERNYSLFQQILTQKTFLLFNRHIDQIILCCFYLVLKGSEYVITFEKIKDSYRKQPQYRPEVLSFVFVDKALSNCVPEKQGSHVGIIRFYNNIFVPNAKVLLEGISSTPHVSKEVTKPNDIGYIPRTPSKSPFQSLPDVSPKKISPSQNVYFSPLQKSKKNSLNSHVGNSFYAFIGESSQAYVSPSKELNSINISLNSHTRSKTSRRLNFDKTDVFISDSLVAESLFPERCKQAYSTGAALAKADMFNI